MGNISIGVPTPQPPGGDLGSILSDNPSPLRRRVVVYGTIPCTQAMQFRIGEPVSVVDPGTGRNERCDVIPWAIPWEDGAQRFVRVAFPAVLNAGDRARVFQLLRDASGADDAFVLPQHVQDALTNCRIEFKAGPWSVEHPPMAQWPLIYNGRRERRIRSIVYIQGTMIYSELLVQLYSGQDYAEFIHRLGFSHPDRQTTHEDFTAFEGEDRKIGLRFHIWHHEVFWPVVKHQHVWQRSMDFVAGNPGHWYWVVDDRAWWPREFARQDAEVLNDYYGKGQMARQKGFITFGAPSGSHGDPVRDETIQSLRQWPVQHWSVTRDIFQRKECHFQGRLPRKLKRHEHYSRLDYNSLRNQVMSTYDIIAVSPPGTFTYQGNRYSGIEHIWTTFYGKSWQLAPNPYMGGAGDSQAIGNNPPEGWSALMFEAPNIFSHNERTWTTGWGVRPVWHRESNGDFIKRRDHPGLFMPGGIPFAGWPDQLGQQYGGPYSTQPFRARAEFGFDFSWKIPDGIARSHLEDLSGPQFTVYSGDWDARDIGIYFWDLLGLIWQQSTLGSSSSGGQTRDQGRSNHCRAAWLWAIGDALDDEQFQYLDGHFDRFIKPDIDSVARAYPNAFIPLWKTENAAQGLSALRCHTHTRWEMAECLEFWRGLAHTAGRSRLPRSYDDWMTWYGNNARYIIECMLGIVCDENGNILWTWPGYRGQSANGPGVYMATAMIVPIYFVQNLALTRAPVWRIRTEEEPWVPDCQDHPADYRIEREFMASAAANINQNNHGSVVMTSANQKWMTPGYCEVFYNGDHIATTDHVGRVYTTLMLRGAPGNFTPDRPSSGAYYDWIDDLKFVGSSDWDPLIVGQMVRRWSWLPAIGMGYLAGDTTKLYMIRTNPTVVEKFDIATGPVAGTLLIPSAVEVSSMCTFTRGGENFVAILDAGTMAGGAGRTLYRIMVLRESDGAPQFDIDWQYHDGATRHTVAFGYHAPRDRFMIAPAVGGQVPQQTRLYTVPVSTQQAAIAVAQPEPMSIIRATEVGAMDIDVEGKGMAIATPGRILLFRWNSKFWGAELTYVETLDNGGNPYTARAVGWNREDRLGSLHRISYMSDTSEFREMEI